MSMIDGLISGLDTTGVINELIAARRAPVERLTSRQTKATSQASAFATIRSAVDQVRAAALALDSSADWRSVKATSSDTTIATVAVSSTASAGTVSFTVDRLAAAHQIVSADAAPATAAWATGNLVIRSGGVDHNVVVPANAQTGVRDLDSVVKAINDAGLGIKAQQVQVAPGEFRLQLSATETGEASEFEIVSGATGAFTVATQGADARIVLANGAYDATSPTNTFDDLLPGVDVTVRKVSTDPVTVSVAADADALANKVQALVNAVNTALSTVRSATKYDSATKTASILTGDPSARRVASDLGRALLGEVTGSSIAAPGLAGISVNKDGSIAFDRAKFLSAYADDPAGVEALFVPGENGEAGIAGRLVTAADSATASGTGYLRSAEQQRRDRATAIADQITAIEERLEREATNLRRKFADMEASLSTLKQQGSWLDGQIAALTAGRE